MKKNDWLKKREQIETRKKKLYEDLSTLQTNCPHENVVYKYDGSGASYDNPSGDYWIDWKCCNCGKMWITDSNIDEVNKYPKSREVRDLKRF